MLPPFWVADLGCVGGVLTRGPLMVGTLGAGVEDAVGTTGRWQVSPNAVNSVPREVVLEVDVRDIDGNRRDKTVASVVEQARAICQRRGTTHTVETINQDDPAICSPMVISRGVHTPSHSHARLSSFFVPCARSL